VNPGQSFRVTAVRAGLAPKAGAEADMPNRKKSGVEYLLAVKIGDRHLGGRDQKEIVGRPIHVIFQLRELPGTEERFAPHQKGGGHLGMAMLQRVDIQEKIDQGALQLCPQSLEDGKSGATHARPPWHVDPVEARPKLFMGNDRKVETARLLPGLHDRVVGGVTDRNRSVGQVRQPVKCGLRRGKGRPQGLLRQLESITQRLHFGLQRRGILPGLSPPANLERFLRPLGAKGLDFGKQAPVGHVRFEELIEMERVAVAGQDGLAQSGRVRSKISSVEHASTPNGSPGQSVQGRFECGKFSRSSQDSQKGGSRIGDHQIGTGADQAGGGLHEQPLFGRGIAGGQ